MTPAFELLANGNRVTPLFADRNCTLSFHDGFGGDAADTLTLEIADPAGDLELPGQGVRIDLALGYTGALTPMGSFTLDEFEFRGPPNVVRFSCRSAPFADSPEYAALNAQKTRSWDASTLGAIVTKIGKEHGMGVKTSVGAAAIKIPHQDQTKSDIHFLTQIGYEHGCFVKFAWGHICILKISEAQTVDGDSIPALTLHRGDVSSYSFSGLCRAAFTGVKARWHDTTMGTTEEILKGDASTPMILDATYPDKATAEGAAQSTLDRLRMQTGSVTLNMPGRTDIVAEGRLKLLGFKSAFDHTTWRIESVDHTLSKAGGYTISVKACVLPE